MRSLKRTNMFRLCLGIAVVAMTANAQKLPSFEAASIHVIPPGQFGRGPGGGPPAMGAKYDASRLSITSMPLRDIIVSAYRLKAYQLEAPDWVRSEMVTISATLPAGETEDHIPEMLQSLLAERFGLKVHRATKDQPVYILTAGKNLKLKDALPDDPDTPPVHASPNGPDFGMMGRMSDAKMSGDPMRGMTMTMKDGQTMKMNISGSGLHIESSKMGMTELTEQLSMFLDLPVIDKTGLKGNYQMALDVSMEDMMNMMRRQGFGGGGPPGDFPGGGGGGFMPPGGGLPEGNGGSVLTSIQQLGLKLEKTKAPGESVIVDQMEKEPTEN